MLRTQLCPKDNNIIIQPEEEITASGVTTRGKPKQVRGVVLAVGKDGVLDHGPASGKDIRVGEMVVYAKGSGHGLRVGNDEYLVLDPDEILAVHD